MGFAESFRGVAWGKAQGYGIGTFLLPLFLVLSCIVIWRFGGCRAEMAHTLWSARSMPCLTVAAFQCDSSFGAYGASKLMRQGARGSRRQGPWHKAVGR